MHNIRRNGFVSEGVKRDQGIDFSGSTPLSFAGIATFAGVFLLFVIFSATKMQSSLNADKELNLENRARSVTTSIASSIESQLQNLEQLLLSNQNLEVASNGLAASPFLAKVSGWSGDGAINPEMIQSVDTEIKGWVGPYLQMLVKSQSFLSQEKRGHFLFSLLNPKRKPFLLLASISNGRQFWGVMSADYFRSLMDRHRGLGYEVSVFNGTDQVLASGVQEYVGTLISDDPVYAEFKRKEFPAGVIKKDKSFAFLEPVSRSNVYVLFSNAQAKELLNGIVWQFLFMAIAATLFAVAILYYLRTKAGIGGFGSTVDLSGQGAIETAAIAMPVAPVTAVADQGPQKVFVGDLALQLKSPILASLANWQVVKSNLGIDETKSDLETLKTVEQFEAQLRKTKDILHQLQIFSGTEYPEIKEGRPDLVLQRALFKFEAKFARKGIELVKNVSPLKAYQWPTDWVERAIEKLIENSIEGLERMASKKINVSLTTTKVGDNEFCQIEIADSGEGISAENLARVFDPFFTTRPRGHQGLGLSVIKGIMDQIGAEIKIASESGNGTKVTLLIPLKDYVKENMADFLNVPSTSLGMQTVSQKSTVATEAAPVQTAEAKILAAAKSEPPPSLIVDSVVERMLDEAEKELEEPKMKDLFAGSLQADPASRGDLMGSGSEETVKIGRPEIQPDRPASVAMTSDEALVRTQAKVNSLIDKPKFPPRHQSNELDSVKVDFNVSNLGAGKIT